MHCVRADSFGRLAGAMLCAALSGCAAMQQMFSAEEDIEVTEVRRLSVCNTLGGAPVLTVLADREAVADWQRQRGVELAGADPLPAAHGYVLVEMGARAGSGYGIAVSRRATVGDGLLRLNATVFTPEPEQARGNPSSPCVLVALPAARFADVELLDPTGLILARAHNPAAPAK